MRVPSKISYYGLAYRKVINDEMKGDLILETVAFKRCDTLVGPLASIAAGYRHTVGLKSDGTVTTAVGDNKYGQYDVSDWRGIQLPGNSLL